MDRVKTVKVLNHLLSVVMFTFLGVFLGSTVFTVMDYLSHPELYEIQSASWYTAILIRGMWMTAIVGVAAMVKLKLYRIFGETDGSTL